MAVNQELEELRDFLEAIPDSLRPGGRVAVISFHSLEDRLVKHTFRREATACVCPPRQPVCTCGHAARLAIVTKKPLEPGPEETAANPRARSAKLRVASAWTGWAVKGVTKEWALSVAFSLLVLLALGLALTWVNIERVDMAYELKRLQTDIDAQQALIGKLEVERNTLLTPERLRTLAREYGLNHARPGQIRRLSEAGEELPSPVLKSVPLPEKPARKAEPAKVQPGPDKKKKKTAADASGQADKPRREKGRHMSRGQKKIRDYSRMRLILVGGLFFLLWSCLWVRAGLPADRAGAGPGRAGPAPSTWPRSSTGGAAGLSRTATA